MITLSRKDIWILVGVGLALVGIIWFLTLYIWGDVNARAAYELGRKAEQARNPAVLFHDSGQAYCYDGVVNYYEVKRSGAGFRIKR